MHILINNRCTVIALPLSVHTQMLTLFPLFLFSEGKELDSLILSDLYYHLEGELEGRKISPGPFKEISEFLLESKALETFQHQFDYNLFVINKDVYLYDPERVRSDLGSDLWDYSNWKESKVIAEKLLRRMLEANSAVLLRKSKLTALKSLITALTICGKDVSSLY